MASTRLDYLTLAHHQIVHVSYVLARYRIYLNYQQAKASRQRRLLPSAAMRLVRDHVRYELTIAPSSQ